MLLLSQRKRLPDSPLFITFNQIHSHLLIGCKTGIKVFELPTDSIKKPRLVLERGHDNDKIFNDSIGMTRGICAFDILELSNLFALVGYQEQLIDSSKVILWDNQVGTVVAEICFTSPVKAVLLRADRIICLLTTKIVIYSHQLPVCKKLYEFDMYWNEFSAFAVSCTPNGCIMAYPARNKGQLQILDITNSPLVPFTSVCSGHDHSISCIAISRTGVYVATSSVKGTLIRVWHSKTATLRHELRRGEIYI